MNNIKIKTKSGFECEIKDTAGDDIEFLTELEELQAGENPMHALKAMKKILGADGYKSLCEHIRTEDGRVPFTVALVEFSEILNEYTALIK